MLLQRLKIEGHSMEPTFKNGDYILITSIPYLFGKPKTGDAVAFKKEGELFLKRVDRIENNKFYLLGDNKKDSLDSRKIGYIERHDIIGKAFKI